MLAPEDDARSMDALRVSLASDIVELVVLSDDEVFLQTLREAVGPSRRLWHVPSSDKVGDLLLAGGVGILVLDAPALREPCASFVTQMKRQFPDLVVVVAGARDAEAGLARLISDGTVYRFIHKPMSPGRARLFADAAVKRLEEQRRRSGAVAAATAIPDRYGGLMIAGGCVAVCAIAGGVWALTHADRRSGADPAHATAVDAGIAAPGAGTAPAPQPGVASGPAPAPAPRADLPIRGRGSSTRAAQTLAARREDAELERIPVLTVEPARSGEQATTAPVAADGASPAENGASPAPDPAAPASTDGVEPVARADTALDASRLVLVKSVPPDYPREARQSAIEGWVELEFTVAESGQVTDLAVRGSNPRGVFEQAARKALSQWRYEPVLVDSEPVPQRARIRIRFALAR